MFAYSLFFTTFSSRKKILINSELSQSVMTFSFEKCNLAKSSLVFSHTDFVLIAV